MAQSLAIGISPERVGCLTRSSSSAEVERPGTMGFPSAHLRSRSIRQQHLGQILDGRRDSTLPELSELSELSD